jgi:hypothetical protein
VKICDAAVELSGANPFGHITGGSLRVRGRLRKVTVARYDEDWAHFLAYATPSEKFVPADFYPDELSPYIGVPRFKSSGSALEYPPTNKEIEAASYPQIIALLFGQFGSGWNPPAAALAIQLVTGSDRYRRIGVLHFQYMRPALTIEEWFNGIDEKELELI